MLQHLSVTRTAQTEHTAHQSPWITRAHIVFRYGNFLESLPKPALGLPSLKELWLESNPIDDAGRLRPSDAEHHLALGPKLRSVGLDQWQVSHQAS